MSYEEILDTRNGYRVKLVLERYAREPHDDFQSPLLRMDGYGAYHIMTGGRPVNDDDRIEEAALRWNGQLPLLEKYLRAYHGATQIITYDSQDYTYITYDSKKWRDYAGASPGSASLAEYKAWIEGDVWGWVIERRETWHAESNPETTMETWEDVTSVGGGFYGYDFAKEAALEEFANATREEEK